MELVLQPVPASVGEAPTRKSVAALRAEIDERELAPAKRARA